MKLKIKILIPAILIGILGLLFFGYTIGHRNGVNQFSKEKTLLNKEILRYKAIVNGDSLYIASVEQEITTQKELIKQGEINRKELKALNIKTVNELTKAKLTINILLDSITNNGVVVIIRDTVTINNDKKAILLPFQFSQKNKWYDLSGGFDIDGKMNAIINVYGDFDVWSGISKDTKKPVAIISTNNPNIQINSISSVKMDLPKVKKFGIGIIGGYGINLSGTIKAQPFIGLGVSYSILRF
jgi:hypothetical protein